MGGSAWLYLKDKNDTKTLDQVKDILAKLPEGQKKYFRIIVRKMLDSIGTNPEVALALSGENNASLGNAFKGPAIKPRRGGTHSYFPYFPEIQTGFITQCPGITKSRIIPVMNERDITPAVARFLGISFPSAEDRIPRPCLVNKYTGDVHSAVTLRCRQQQTFTDLPHK